MNKCVLFILIIYFAFISLTCDSQQQPLISVQSFEYVWQRTGSEGDGTAPIILARQDDVKQSIEKSFAQAIKQRWNIDVPGITLSVKALSLFSISNSPKFNTKLKDKQPGTWYLFLQIFDKSNSSLYYNQDGSISRTLEVKCKLIAFNDSIISDKSLFVKMKSEKAPADQVVLKRLPAYPSYFKKSFDSIANWIFQPGDIYEKEISLKPACVFFNKNVNVEPLMQMQFQSDNTNILLLTEPKFSFQTQGPIYTKTTTKRNTGGNIANGAVTLLTGLKTNKEKTLEYVADFPFALEDSTAYHCTIHYTETELAEQEREKEKESNGGKSYSMHSDQYAFYHRNINPAASQVITYGQDTIATFKIQYINNTDEQNSDSLFWDGSDSTTITNLPKGWNNGRGDDNVILSGQIGGNVFTMKTLKELTEKEFYIDSKLVMIMDGKTLPAKAMVFQTLSPQEIKIFTILSSLPYSFFNSPAD